MQVYPSHNNLYFLYLPEMLPAALRNIAERSARVQGDRAKNRANRGQAAGGHVEEDENRSSSEESSESSDEIDSTSSEDDHADNPSEEDEEEEINKWTVHENSQLEEFEGRKGPIMCLRNYIFYKRYTGNLKLDKESVTGALFKCQYERSGCPKKLALVDGNYYRESFIDHNHAADPFDIGSRRVLKKASDLMKADPNMSPREVMTKSLEGVHDSVSEYIDRMNWKRKLQRQKERLLGYPRGKTSADKLVIPPEWKIYPSNEEFVIYDDKLDSGRIIIMTSPFMMAVLANADVCAGDGTFDMRFPPKRKWAQIYSLHAYVAGAFVPAVVIASTNRTAATYIAASTEVQNWIRNKLEIEWKPKVVSFLSPISNDSDFLVLGGAHRLRNGHPRGARGCFYSQFPS